MFVFGKAISRIDVDFENRCHLCAKCNFVLNSFKQLETNQVEDFNRVCK